MSASTSAKAGKKHKYQAPPAPNADKAAARAAGRQQFTAKVFPKLAPDVDAKAARQFDTGWRWDAERQQTIGPPARKQPEAALKVASVSADTKPTNPSHSAGKALR